MKVSNVAVMGAGLTGSLVALELAERGIDVDLLDREAAPLTQASLRNEGKIHLGLVYAKDTSGITARRMIEGAFAFLPLLERWIDSATLAAAISDPFVYAVPRSSALTDDEVQRYFRETEAIYREVRDKPGRRYLAEPGVPLFRRVKTSEHSALFDDKLVSSSFITAERSIDPQPVAANLRETIVRSPRLTLIPGAEVLGVTKQSDERLVVETRRDGTRETNSYDAVVNTLWQDRLAIDATVGLKARLPVTHRYKVGLNTTPGDPVSGMPTVTFVHGPFGDTVAFPDRSYASWYPVGLLRQETALRPGYPAPELSDAEAATVIDASLDALARLMPGACKALVSNHATGRWQVHGGFITAWARSGIEDPDSMLHRRDLVDVTSDGMYHSVDTGKYTLAPLQARLACGRVLGLETAF